MSITDFTKRVREIKELEIMIKELKSEAEAIKDELKAEMSARNTEELTVDIFTIRYKEISRKDIDKKALRKEMPEIAEKFNKTIVSKTFTIT